MPNLYNAWDSTAEPDETNIRSWMNGIYQSYESLEQARWNQANIDTLFYAGEQKFINSYFRFSQNQTYQDFHFNLIQQPVNMITGYQRQHRKSISYAPVEGSKQEFADDMTTVSRYANSYRQVLEKFSQACELATISGMVMIQPWLDFKNDPINGTFDLKVWPYNSFIVDPFFRNADMSDANFVWCQQYISKRQAMNSFPDRAEKIQYMSNYAQDDAHFYFLPENYNLKRNDLLVLSYIWYQSTRKKKFLYNKEDGITYDYADQEEGLNDLIQQTGLFEVLEYDVPTWKLAVVLNQQLMYNGDNPLEFDECPLIPVFWNYDPHIAQPDLRCRSLVRSMRDTQFLMNRRIIINHDISESSINSGWKRIEDAVVNEEDLRYSGQGKDVIIKQGYGMQDVEKIVPNAVPASDMQLAEQLADFIYKTSGISQENLGMADDTDVGITTMLRQGAGLITLQKYFDQWDTSLKLLGILQQKIIQNKWSAAKIARILGKQPNVEFISKTFSKYDVLVEEGVNTTIQQQQQFLQTVKLNEMLGGIIPPSYILQISNLQGKNELIKAVEAQQEQAQQVQMQEQMLKQAQLEAQIQKLKASSVADVAMARERHGRAESNIGLFEERLSEITQNRASALKDKVEALEKLINIFRSATASEEVEAESQMLTMNQRNINQEDREKIDAKSDAISTKFLTNMMQQNQSTPNMEVEEQNLGALL